MAREMVGRLRRRRGDPGAERGVAVVRVPAVAPGVEPEADRGDPAGAFGIGERPARIAGGIIEAIDSPTDKD